MPVAEARLSRPSAPDSTGEMVLLSEQQLVDCAGQFDNHGCSGGLPSHAFEYIAAAGGLDTEEAYPYEAEESGSCSYVRKGVGADVVRSVNITYQDETELLEAVGNTGPVSVAFQVWLEGLFAGPRYGHVGVVPNSRLFRVSSPGGAVIHRAMQMEWARGVCQGIVRCV